VIAPLAVATFLALAPEQPLEPPVPTEIGAGTLAAQLFADVGVSAVLMMSTSLLVWHTRTDVAEPLIGLALVLAPALTMPLGHLLNGTPTRPFDGWWPMLARAAALVPAWLLSNGGEQPYVTAVLVTIIGGAILDTWLANPSAVKVSAGPARPYFLDASLGFCGMLTREHQVLEALDIALGVGAALGARDDLAFRARALVAGGSFLDRSPSDSSFTFEAGARWRHSLVEDDSLSPYFAADLGASVQPGCEGKACGGVSARGGLEAGVAAPLDAGSSITMAAHAHASLVTSGVPPPAVFGVSLGYLTR
jgi:hypothetical protein